MCRQAMKGRTHGIGLCPAEPESLMEMLGSVPAPGSLSGARAHQGSPAFSTCSGQEPLSNGGHRTRSPGCVPLQKLVSHWATMWHWDKDLRHSCLPVYLFKVTAWQREVSLCDCILI